MNKKVFICLILFIIFLLGNKNINILSELKNELRISDIHHLDQIFELYDIEKPSEINSYDPNVYYIYAYLIYKKLGHNEWSDQLFADAVNNSDLFQLESFKYYIDSLVQKNSWGKLKNFIYKNKDIITSEDDKILLYFASDKNIEDIDHLSSNIENFPFIFQIIKNDPIKLEHDENILKLHEYIINSKFYNNLKSVHLNNLKEIVKYSKYDPFISSVYYYLSKNKSSFLKETETLLKSQISKKKLSIIRSLSIKSGLRKNFYYLISKYRSNNKYTEYYSALGTIHYENYSKGIQQLKDILPKFDQIDDYNYNIRYRILYSSINLSEKWIKKVISLNNDFPDKYHSQNLLNVLYRKAVLTNKLDKVIPLYKHLNVESFEAFYKSIFFYRMVLIDKENRELWENMLKREFPVSYAALTVNDGKIDIKRSEPIIYIKKERLTKKANLLFKKIEYLLKYNFIEEAKRIDIVDLTKYEKIYIYDIFYSYFLKSKDYYSALKYSKLITNEKYNENYLDIDNLEVLKILYPLHYKDHIIKYSKIYDVDPALAFAVMREESHFKKDIVSHANAIGLMQIIPSTGKFIAQKLKISKYNLRDPEDNIKMGTYYLKFLERYFKNTQFILSSYNAGQGRTLQWYNTYKKYSDELKYELIPIPETRHYIRKVMKSYYIYKYLLENENIYYSAVSMK